MASGEIRFGILVSPALVRKIKAAAKKEKLPAMRYAERVLEAHFAPAAHLRRPIQEEPLA